MITLAQLLDCPNTPEGFLSHVIELVEQNIHQDTVFNITRYTRCVIGKLLDDNWSSVEDDIMRHIGCDYSSISRLYLDADEGCRITNKADRCILVLFSPYKDRIITRDDWLAKARNHLKIM